MWISISLRSRIYLILIALVFISLVGGVVLVWYTYQMEKLLTSIISRDLTAYRTAETLATALINQKGFVSYYFLDGDPDWLRQLGEHRQIFREKLNLATSRAEKEEEKRNLELIESEYQAYIGLKDRVIDYYKNGKREAGAMLHQKVRRHFFKILDLCENYKNIYTSKIIQASAKTYIQARKLRVIAWVAMLFIFCLATLLALVLANQILEPIHRLAVVADREKGSLKSKNEIKALSRSVRDLIEDVDHTQSELKKSQEHLLQAEKMALVGKLAAGMAHSIRNPFTSVKMRLFSLSRSLDLSGPQEEDFEVISQEIRQVDTIVQNFLEFSRPPRLKMQSISPSTVVDSAIQLLEHRLKSYDVTIKVNRKDLLPKIQADPEQLKEVLVNLVVNACESMENGGLIVIKEERAYTPPLGQVAVIRLSDNGPGIPESIQDKILQPFFTTKEEGTGLGLSIAARIVEQHGGWLDLNSKEGEGTTFILTLPAKETGLEHHLDY